MDKHLTASFKKQLLAKRASLLSQITALRGGAVGRAQAASDHFGEPENSRAQTVTERELEFALDERDTAELAAVDEALLRIEGGTYGQCTGCGIDIPAPRLHAAPEAVRCISCQDRAEHKHGKLAAA